MNKNNLLLIIVSLVSMCIICFGLFLNFPSPNRIYRSVQPSIVELKSQTGNDIVSYGTAVIIDDNGTLVTNAHLVAYKESGVYKQFESFEIRFSYENEYREVVLIKYDIDLDLAVLKLKDITNVDFNHIKFGKSSQELIMA